MLLAPEASGLGTLLHEGRHVSIFRRPSGATAILAVDEALSLENELTEGLWQGARYACFEPILDILARRPRPLPESDRRGVLQAALERPDGWLHPENLFWTDQGWRVGPVPGRDFANELAQLLSWSAGSHPDGLSEDWRELIGDATLERAREWRPRPAQSLEVYRELDGPAFDLALSPDGLELAWLDDPWTDRMRVTTLRLDTGQLCVHEGVGMAIAYSPRGQLTAFDHHGLVRFQQGRWRKLAPLNLTYASPAVAYSADGRWMAAVTRESLVLLDPDTGQERFIIPEERGRALALSPDGSQLAVLGQRLAVFELPVGRLLACGYRHGEALSFDAQGQLWTGWNQELCNRIGRHHPEHPAWITPQVRSIAWGPDGQSAHVTPGRLHLAGLPSVEASGLNSVVWGAGVLATGGDKVQLWRPSPRPPVSLTRVVRGPVSLPARIWEVPRNSHLVLSPTGDELILNGGGGFAIEGQRYELQDGIKAVPRRDFQTYRGQLREAWFSPTGRYLVGIDDQHRLHLFDWETRQCLPAYRDRVDSCHFFDEDRKVLLGTTLLSVFSLPSWAAEVEIAPGRPAVEPPPGATQPGCHVYMPAQVAVSPNGRFLASVQDPDTVVRWDLGGRQVARWEDAGGYDLALNDRWLTVSRGNRVRLYSVEDEREVPCRQQRQGAFPTFCPANPDWLFVRLINGPTWVYQLPEFQLLREIPDALWVRWVGRRLLVHRKDNAELIEIG